MTGSLTEAALFELLSLDCRVHSRGDMTYHNSDRQLHRVHGPAIEYKDGGCEWYQNGLLHRLDGPAVEYPSGLKVWYQNGQRHRLDGPAIEYSDGYRAWYINGKELTEATWLQEVTSMENA